MNNVFICRLPIVHKIVGPSLKDTPPVRYQSTKQKSSTFYDILNLKPGSTKKEIRNSFIKLSKLNHPDVCGPSSSDRFIRITEAYNVLIDETKRKLYDDTLMNTKSNKYPIHYNYPLHKNSGNWKNVYDNNHWLSSNVTIAGFCLSVLIIGSVIRYYGLKRSTSIRGLLLDESDECLSFLEEQKLMKVDKSKDELIKIFEKNIIKEYGHVTK